MSRPLAIIVIGDHPQRLLAALRLAAASAALGRQVGVFFDQGAVAAALDPALAPVIDDLRDLGVGFAICATGIAERGIAPDSAGAMAIGGLLHFLSQFADPELVVV